MSGCASSMRTYSVAAASWAAVARCSINTFLGEAMKLVASFATDEHKIDPNRTIKYNDVIDVLDTCLENVDLTLDKIKV